MSASVTDNVNLSYQLHTPSEPHLNTPELHHHSKNSTVYVTRPQDFKTVSLILLNAQIKKLLYENIKKLSATGRKPVCFMLVKCSHSMRKGNLQYRSYALCLSNVPVVGEQETCSTVSMLNACEMFP